VVSALGGIVYDGAIHPEQTVKACLYRSFGVRIGRLLQSLNSQCVASVSVFLTAKSCPRGMQYSECLPKIQRTCATLYSVASFSTDADTTDCFPGCHCPAGKLLHAGECVTPQDCPCQYQKQFYSAGQVVKIDCNYWYASPHSSF